MFRRPAPAGHLDQLGQGPAGDEQLGRVVARALGCNQRLAVAPESVEQDRLDELAPLDGKSLTHGGSVVDRRLEPREPVSLPTLEATSSIAA
jgi:hypothetical protein